MQYKLDQVESLNKDIKNHFPHVFQIDKEMKTSHSGISRMVMLDRYTQKDLKLITLKKGDLVVAKIKEDPQFPTLGIGYVISVNGKKVKIEIEQEYKGQIDPHLKPNDGVITLNKNSIQKPLEIYYEQIARRVGRSLAWQDTPDWGIKFEKQIKDLKIIPAGRVLYGAGSDSKSNLF